MQPQQEKQSQNVSHIDSNISDEVETTTSRRDVKNDEKIVVELMKMSGVVMHMQDNINDVDHDDHEYEYQHGTTAIATSRKPSIEATQLRNAYKTAQMLHNIKGEEYQVQLDLGTNIGSSLIQTSANYYHRDDNNNNNNNNNNNSSSSKNNDNYNSSANRYRHTRNIRDLAKLRKGSKGTKEIKKEKHQT